jgi:Na+-driven multidrug efflux pump
LIRYLGSNTRKDVVARCEKVQKLLIFWAEMGIACTAAAIAAARRCMVLCVIGQFRSRKMPVCLGFSRLKRALCRRILSID